MTKEPRAEGGGRHSTLTATHRQYLLDILKKEGNTEAQAKKAIRDRIEESLFDFMLLFYYLDEKDIRLAFEEGANQDEGPIEYSMPSWAEGMVGTGFGDKQGYPREGDYNTGFDGRSMHQATIENVLRENSAIKKSPSEDADQDELLDSTESKASPGTQRALIHSIAFLCRIAEAGQLNIRDVVEQGLETYYREYTGIDRIPAVTKDRSETVQQKPREGEELLPGEWRGLERRGLLEMAIESAELSDSTDAENSD